MDRDLYEKMEISKMNDGYCKEHERKRKSRATNLAVGNFQIQGLKITVNRIFTASNSKTEKLGSIRADLYNSQIKLLDFSTDLKHRTMDKKLN
jgi:hypothetical protein